MAKLDKALAEPVGRTYMNANDFFENLDERRAEREARPWYVKAASKTHRELFGTYGFVQQNLHPRRVMNKGVWTWQRAHRGWADCDTWSVDTYVTKVVSEMLVYLADTTHSYPGSEEFNTPEKWDAHLRDLAKRLRTWNDDTFADKTSYETTKAAMEEFGRNLGHYWD
jgi:hypothetical protein